MGCAHWLRPVLVTGLAALLVACSGGLPEPLAEGRFGGPLNDEGCDWQFARSVNTTGVDFSVDRANGVGGGSASVWPRGSDDPIWMTSMTPCVDAPRVVFGGVDGRADAVVVRRADGAEIELELFDVEDRPWTAVVGELPLRWYADADFDIEFVASVNGDELAREGFEPGLRS